MNSDIQINLANNSDKLQLLTFFQHYHQLQISSKRVDCFLHHNFTVVAKDKAKIIGLVQWSIKENPQSGVVELEEFYVLEAYRQQGIGTAILDFALKSIANYFKSHHLQLRRIYLFVSQNNLPARKLYEKAGFKNQASLDNLFADDQTELFYCLDVI